MNFPVNNESIEKLIQKINPKEYARTRNFKNGSITHLGPYLSRGYLSTKIILKKVKAAGHSWSDSEKLVQELLWRDYWQLKWQTMAKLNPLENRSTQELDSPNFLPKAIHEAKTGIAVVDHAIKELYSTGYMHNHMRMYVASICCNIAGSNWQIPARWMYANLLDGDVASNSLNWQWVSGKVSKKKYYANQDNINKYFFSDQKETFLDVSYDKIQSRKAPGVLKESFPLNLKTKLPCPSKNATLSNQKTLLYNYYNLDPNWKAEQSLQRVLLLEPSAFQSYPISHHCLQFALALANNIRGLKIFIGEFTDLSRMIDPQNVIYKEHPLNSNYLGKEEERDWMTQNKEDFPSFFKFWNTVKGNLKW